jgi:hypothetical protein
LKNPLGAKAARKGEVIGPVSLLPHAADATLNPLDAEPLELPLAFYRI